MNVGVYVDFANIVMNGGFGMRYDILRDFACRNDAKPIRLNAYVSFDPERAKNDHDYKIKQYGFHSILRDFGFKVIQKDVKWYVDDEGNRVGKSNVDLELAVDALLQSESLDRVIFVTGDGDFVQVVNALQNKGCRVEVIAFDNVSAELRRSADQYTSGYLIPNLLPITRGGKSSANWSEMDSFVRGVCYAHDAKKGFGWVRYLANLDGELWHTDSRDPRSPYRTIFCHDSVFPADFDPSSLPDRGVILEFKITPGAESHKTKAEQLRVIRALT